MGSVGFVLWTDGSESAEQWVADWSASAAEQVERARALADRVAGLTSTASGAHGAVRVTVASSGAVTGLELSDEVTGWPGREIADQVLETMRRAQAGLAPLVADAVADTVGLGSESGQAVVTGYEERFPPPADTDGDRRGRGHGR